MSSTGTTACSFLWFFFLIVAMHIAICPCCTPPPSSDAGPAPRLAAPPSGPQPRLVSLWAAQGRFDMTLPWGATSHFWLSLF